MPPWRIPARELEPRGFLLVDSGGQYRDGTTDITRTYALGPLDGRGAEAYTLVLKCHIAAAARCSKREARACISTFWRGKHSGGAAWITAAVRATAWDLWGLSTRARRAFPQKNDTPFEPGMTVTDEPGIYEEGKLGVRIENELLCVPVCETEYGAFMALNPSPTVPLTRAL